MRRTIHERASRENGKVKNVIKQMDLPLHCHHFNEKAFIRVLDFLAHFTGEANFQELSKTQEFVTFPSFLEGFVLRKYAVMVGMTPLTERGITCSTKEVQ